MDDQFGGRTDDDLFYDDFEPVESEPVVTEEAPAPKPEPAPIAPIQEPVAAQEQPPAQPPASSAPPAKPAGLASSRYADKPAPAPKSARQAPPQTSNAPPNAPTAPREKGPQNTAANASARLQSGANPRQKLTEAELAARMERMKLVSAEKARKFEKAEQDEKDHAASYARGMEEARKRRAAEAERRRQGEEDRRKMEDERAKNRERKLKAMGMKEGGWDEGKEALEEEEARRGFRGANGGIRGSRSTGLGDSRYASRDGEEHDVDRFLDERHRGGRGRGRGRGGRGGRGGREDAPRAPAPVKQAVPAAEDFPALPGEGKKTAAPAPASNKPAFAKAAAAPPPPLEPLSPGGKWVDEMEEFDELNNKS